MLPMLLSFLLVADPAWSLSGQRRGGLRWYTRPNTDHSLSDVRATAVIDAPTASVWAVLLDYEAYVKTMPSTSASVVLEREGDTVTWVYLRYAVPFIADRDTVVRMDASSEPDGGVRLLSWRADDNAKRAPAPPVVRLPVNTGFWRLEPRNGGRRTALTYQLQTRVAGDMPTVFVNAAHGVALPQTFGALTKAAKTWRPAVTTASAP